LGLDIRIDPHTLERAEERGTDERESADVVTNCFSIPAKAGRLGKAKVYSFQQTRHGRRYEQKWVEVIYVLEGDAAITVTVYVFYGQWEDGYADHV
jgi:hypothetical protein